MSNHTPGPWKIDEAEDLALGVIRDTPDGEGICTLDPEKMPSEASAEELANARLIAAAPDMLAVLQKLYIMREHGGDAMSRYAHEVRAAIRAAAGELPPIGVNTSGDDVYGREE